MKNDIIDTAGRYDNIANIMGVPGQSFVDMHNDKINEIKRSLINYVKSLQQTANTIVNLRPPEPQAHQIAIQVTSEGYPILPANIQFARLNKTDITDMIRQYLNAHYSKIELYSSHEVKEIIQIFK
jgi:hypothetical protein